MGPWGKWACQNGGRARCSARSTLPTLGEKWGRWGFEVGAGQFGGEDEGSERQVDAGGEIARVGEAPGAQDTTAAARPMLGGRGSKWDVWGGIGANGTAGAAGKHRECEMRQWAPERRWGWNGAETEPLGVRSVVSGLRSATGVVEKC